MKMNGSVDLMGFRFLQRQVTYHLVDPELLQHVGMCQLSFRVAMGINEEGTGRGYPR